MLKHGILLLVGPHGAGKSTLASFVEDCPRSVYTSIETYEAASPLWRIFLASHPHYLISLVDASGKNDPYQKAIKEAKAKTNDDGSPTPRELVIKLGVHLEDIFGKDWLFFQGLKERSRLQAMSYDSLFVWSGIRRRSSFEMAMSMDRPEMPVFAVYIANKGKVSYDIEQEIGPNVVESYGKRGVVLTKPFDKDPNYGKLKNWLISNDFVTDVPPFTLPEGDTRDASS